MKTSKLFFLAFVAAVNCNPLTNGSPSRRLSDEEALELIAKPIREIARLVDSLPLEELEGLSDFVVQSIDTKCMLNKYKKNNALDKIPRTEFDPEHPEKNILQHILYADFAFQCVRGIQNILGYAFDNLHLKRVELEEMLSGRDKLNYFDMLQCAEDYTVTRGLLDPKVYGIDASLKGHQTQLCAAWREQVSALEEMMSFQLGEFSCTENLVEIVKNDILKYGVLIQLDLTLQQKREVRQSLHQDFRAFLDEVMKCTISEFGNPRLFNFL